MSNQLQVSGEAKIRSIQGPVVANSGVITALDGDASQYVRGDGTLADFPTSTGGGSSVSYYLNSSVSQGTIGGVAYKQLSKVPISGAGTDVSTSANGYIASYITDANDPALLEVPAGNFNCEFYFSVNNNTGNPYVYAELYKYDGTTFTLLGTSVGVPEYITEGTVINPYYFAVPVATSVLTVTDRISIRIYVNVDGRTVTLHTENNHLCQVVTTFSKGLISLNNLTRQNQFFQTGTSGTDFAISSATATHTFNLPVASASNTGKLSSTDWSTFNGKVPYTGATANVDLGDYSIKVNGILAYGASGSGGLIGFRQTGTLAGVATGSAYIGSVSAGKLNIYFGDAGLEAAILDNSLLTADRTYNFPDASGTLALLSADQTFTGINSFDYGINYKTGASLANVSGYISQAYATSGTGAGSTLSLKISDGNSVKAINLDFVGSPATYTYTFPDLSGTLALTSQLGSYLPLAGGIMTGSLLLNNNLTISGQLFGTSSYASMLAMSPSDKVLIDNSGRGVIFGGTIGQGAYTYTFPSASGTFALLSANQTFTGLNTFSSVANMTATLQVQQGLLLNQGIQANALAPYTAISGRANGLFICPNSGTGYDLIFPSSSSYQYTFPASTGTIALTSNLSSYVPYTGATQNVSLGSNVVTAGSFYSQAGIFLSISGQATSGSGFATINGGATYLDFRPNNGGIFLLSFPYSTTRTFTLPDATGTIALTSNLSSYLPLTGGTLTGQLYINPTNTATVGLDVASNTTRFRSDNLEGFKRQLEITMGSGTLVQCVAKGFGANYGTDLAFYTATTGGVNASPAIYITGTNNRVGIKTGTPAYDLDVAGTLGISGLFTSTAFGSNSFSAGGTGYNKLTIRNTTAGAANGAQLSIGTNADPDQFYVQSFATTFTTSGMNIAGGAVINGEGPGGLSIAATQSNIGFYTNGAAAGNLRMTITSAGNVGIGTSSPNYTTANRTVLDINGTNESLLSFSNGGTARGYIYNTSGGQVYWTEGNRSMEFGISGTGYMGFGTNNTERMRIINNGNICMATSTDFGYKLNLNGQPGCNGYTAWTNWSDSRLKENVTDLETTNVLDKICAIRPVTYNYNELSGFDEETRARRISGFIAQELMKVFPDMVGTIKKGDDEYYDTNLSNLTLYLVKAVQELSAQNQDLKSRLDKAGL